jgi:hypothetical protein
LDGGASAQKKRQSGNQHQLHIDAPLQAIE